MRRAVLVSFLLLALGGCMTSRSDGSPQILTPEDANKENLQGAVSSPLRDLNVVRTEIPEVLLQAMADPYAGPGKPLSCGRLATLLGPLDLALGPDLDQPPEEEGDTTEKSRSMALGAVAGVASGAIPFRSWVRGLTGAQRHDRLVQAAILAGGVRRGYLKGLGEARGCPPPATPSHQRAGTPVIDQRIKPRYDIR